MINVAKCFFAVSAAAAAIGATSPGMSALAQQALNLEAKIPLGDVRGRIDHLAIDLARQRLFVAELGNDSLAVVDLQSKAVIKRIEGLKEVQGVAYAASNDTVFAAAGGDASVFLFKGDDLHPDGAIKLGEDPDNVRVDAATGRVYVGYASGAIAVIDPAKRARVSDFRLPGHPESFQLWPAQQRIFVNVPSAQQVAVLDMATGDQVATWRLAGAGGNFPMALDEPAGTVLVVTRSPAQLFVIDTRTGGFVEQFDTCGDADDVFVDGRRSRFYVVCGEGFVDVFESTEATYQRTSVPTAPGARTGLFVPELDRLFVAVRASGSESAAIWVFRPIR